MSATFSDLGVPESITAALAQRGINRPFEIQAATIADALAGRDVCGRAPTGSGKTLAFGIPLVATVERGTTRRPRALILVPTRELAEQITTALETIAGRVRIGCVYGGVSYTHQINALKRGVDILVACPGRLEDLIAQQLADLSDVDKVVIDEADRMADMGFMPAVRRLLDQTTTPRQTVLFSATLDGDVAKLTRDYQNDPVRHEVGEETPDVTAADHVFWRTGKTNRTELTVDAVNAVWPAIIFSRTRHGSDRLARSLQQNGIRTAAIHGGRSQRQRNQALMDFAKGRVQALVATDVAARGIHVDGVASVIHFDPPEDQKAYIHRSGRTARAGRSGVILSLIQPDQVKGLRRMQREVGLDEPLLDPDPMALRALSDNPGAPLASALGAVRTDDDEAVEHIASRSDRPSRAGRLGRPERPARSRRDEPASGPSERSDRADRGPRPGSSGRSELSDRPVRGSRPAGPERSGFSDRPVRGSRPAGPERSGFSDRPVRGSRPAGPERSGFSDRPVRGSRPAGAERSGFSDRPVRGSRPPADDRQDRSDRPARGPDQSPVVADERGDRPARGAVKPTSRTRTGRPGTGPPDRDRGPGAGAASDRPARPGSGPARSRAKPGVGASAGNGAARRSGTSGNGRSAVSNSAGNRKARRAHLQWG